MAWRKLTTGVTISQDRLETSVAREGFVEDRGFEGGPLYEDAGEEHAARAGMLHIASRDRESK